MQCREMVVRAIEADAERFRLSGAAEQWLSKADEATRGMSSQVNGPVFELLLSASGHPDKDCADLLRFGAPLLGKLPVAGNGRPEQKKAHASLSELKTNALEGNKAVLKRFAATLVACCCPCSLATLVACFHVCLCKAA